MSLKFLHFVDLPEHIAPGGFDHAAVHDASNTLYVAHTINNALDVIDCKADQFLYSIPGLTGVAGALVSIERDLVFTSIRGENTVGIFSPADVQGLVKVQVGIRPNGLAFDPFSGLLLAGNVGDPEIANSYTLSIVDVKKKEMIASIQIPGRTRWAVYNVRLGEFYVNISDPAQVVVVEVANPNRLKKSFPVPAAGPHGLDLDMEQGILFCACDAGVLFSLSASNGALIKETELSGKPDVIFFNPSRKHLYVAVGDPGVIDVIETDSLKLLETIPTEKGAHTLAYDSQRNKVFAFLPMSHRAQVFIDE